MEDGIGFIQQINELRPDDKLTSTSYRQGNSIIIHIQILRRFMSAKATLILSLLLVFSSCAFLEKGQVISVDSQYVPVPKRYPGLFIGSTSAALNIELIYDPTCDGSAAFDHVIRDFVQGLDEATLSQISFKYAINILPYHIASDKLAMAVRYTYDHQGSEEALRVLRYFLDNLESWNEDAIRKITINQFLNNLAGQVSSLTGLARDDIRTELAHFSKTDNLTRQWSKYVMGTLRIPGTPFMFVNGVRVDGATDMDAAKLTTYIKALL